MSFSQSKETILKCKRCQREFPYEVWTIVDSGERPDLLEKIREGSIHAVLCPYCGLEAMLDAPLLIFQPERAPYLIYVSVTQATPEQNQEIARQLMRELQAATKDKWRDDWIRYGVPVLPPYLVATALEEGLDAALEVIRQTQIQETGSDIPVEMQVHVQIAQQAMLEYADTGEIDALDRAISAWETISRSSAPRIADSSFQLTAMDIAGGLLLERYWAEGHIEDLEQALKRTQQAVGLTPPSSPDEAGRLKRLSTVLASRYKHFNDLDNLEQALRAARQAVDLTSDEHFAKAEAFNNLGKILFSRYERFTDTDDLEQAIHAHRRAVDLTPSRSPERAKFLFDLGGVFATRYRQSYDSDDLEQAIQALQQAVDLSPEKSSSRGGRLNSLGTTLSDRYKRYGNPEDLRQAIQTFREAVALTPPKSPNKAGRLSNLGLRLFDRYKRYGDLADLEKSLQAVQQAIELTPPGSPKKAGLLNGMSAIMETRYERFGDVEDLEQAIQVIQQVVEQTSQNSPDKAMFLHNLGNLLLSQYRHSKDLISLEQAIQVAQQAVDLTHSESPDRGGRLTSLGILLNARYERFDDFEDLEQAILLIQQAIEITPDRHPEKAAMFLNLGGALADRHRRTGNLADLEGGKTSYQNAITLANDVNPEILITASRAWGRWALKRRIWGEAAQAFRPGFDTINDLVRQHALRSSKEAWISGAQDISASLAYTLARDQKLEQAVEVLESGRARLLSEQISEGRIDLQELEKDAPELVRKYQTLTTQAIHWRSNESGSIQDVERVRGQLRLINQQLTALAKDIRDVEGFEYFLTPVTLDDIYEAAHDYPVAYIIAAPPVGGMMLFVLPGKELDVLWFGETVIARLPEQIRGKRNEPELSGYLGTYYVWRSSLDPKYNGTDVDKKRAWNNWLNALDDTTQWLWDGLMGKLTGWLAERGYKRCTLVPTGLFTLLPLHAAWTKDETTPTRRHYALDDILFTYTPNAFTLLNALGKIHRPTLRIMAIDNPDHSLRFSESEVQAVLEHFPEQVHLLHQAATLEAIKREIDNANVLHFSTHGLAQILEPLESLLVTADQPLKLRDILTLKLDQVRLAVLSACETGLPGVRNVDESNALPTGLLQAGVPGVVGSIWLVADVSTMMLMERFYRFWKEDGFEPPKALRNAQQWLRDTTNKEKEIYYVTRIQNSKLENSILRPDSAVQVAYREMIIRAPDVRSFWHPFFWAAFGYFGV
jgi:CHAT domain-containing protein/tetratricopeptide (TPR) repeat protein